MPSHHSLQQSAQSILFVDDEKAVLKSLERFGRGQNWNIYTALSAQEAMAVMDDIEVDIIVSDMRMPGMDGAELLENVKIKHPKTVRILLTGFSDVLSLEAAINRGGIFNYLSKPWDDLLLSQMLDKALEHRNHEKEREHLQKENRKQFKKLGVLALSLDRLVKERTMETEQALTLLTNLQEQASKKYHNTLGVIRTVIGWRYPKIAKKLAFVESFSPKMAEAMDLNTRDTELLNLSSQLYIIGVLSLPEEICNKATFQLTPAQKKEFQHCAALGGRLLAESEALAGCADIIKHCFTDVELKSDKSKPVISGIIQVLNDFYDLSQGQLVINLFGKIPAIDYINKHAGTVYDKSVVDAFSELVTQAVIAKPSSLILDTVHLRSGMKLALDVPSAQGAILLTAGSVLSERHILLLEEQHKQRKLPLYVEVIPE